MQISNPSPLINLKAILNNAYAVSSHVLPLRFILVTYLLWRSPAWKLRFTRLSKSFTAQFSHVLAYNIMSGVDAVRLYNIHRDGVLNWGEIYIIKYNLTIASRVFSSVNVI